MSLFQKLIKQKDSIEKINKRTEERNKVLPWIEKYRPKKLEDVVGHDSAIKIFRRFIERKEMTHILLYGTPGTGKTSTIMACAKELYGQTLPYMVLEMNASDERGIEYVRQKVIRFVEAESLLGGNELFKLIILDETDAMTDKAQCTLRRVMEE